MGTVRVKLARPREDYQMRNLMKPSKWTERELRAEYSRLRSVAVKRIGRLLESDFADSETVAQNVDRFVKLSQINTREDVEAYLNEVVRFLGSKWSSVSGQKEIRKKTIASLNDVGFPITEADYGKFGKYMEWARRTQGATFDSDQAADIFTSAQYRGISINTVIANYKLFQEHFDEILVEDFDAPVNTKGMSSAAILKELGIDDKLNKPIRLDKWYEKHMKGTSKRGKK